MKIAVLLFAAAKEVAGQPEIQVELPPKATVGDLRKRIIATNPAFKPLAPTLLFAVNSLSVSDDVLLAEGDEVACFPPVSGG